MCPVLLFMPRAGRPALRKGGLPTCYVPCAMRSVLLLSVPPIFLAGGLTAYRLSSLPCRRFVHQTHKLSRTQADAGVGARFLGGVIGGIRRIQLPHPDLSYTSWDRCHLLGRGGHLVYEAVARIVGGAYRREPHFVHELGPWPRLVLGRRVGVRNRRSGVARIAHEYGLLAEKPWQRGGSCTKSQVRRTGNRTPTGAVRPVEVKDGRWCTIRRQNRDGPSRAVRSASASNSRAPRSAHESGRWPVLQPQQRADVDQHGHEHRDHRHCGEHVLEP